MDKRRRISGIMLILASTVLFGLSGVFTKLAVSDAWTIACWRGLVGSVLIAAYVFWPSRGDKPVETLRLGWRGWALAAVGGVSSLLFLASFKATYVANVAVIYATVPFLAAGMEWIALGRAPGRRTLVMAALAFAGVVIVAFGGLGTGHLWGDFLALLMAVGCALYLVMVRAFSDTPAVWAAAVSAFLIFLVGWFISDPLAVPSTDIAVIGGFGIAFAGAAILWTEGARRIPAAEAGLLGTAEIPFAALFAWLVLGESAPATSFLGGAVIVAAVLFHATREIRAASLTTAPAPAA